MVVKADSRQQSQSDGSIDHIFRIMEDTFKVVSDSIIQTIRTIIGGDPGDGSATVSVIYYMAWVFILFFVFKIIRFIFPSIFHDIIKTIVSIFNVRRYFKKNVGFPNVFFDPYDRIALPRMRSFDNKFNGLWAFFGTDADFIHGLRPMDLVGRYVCGAIILITCSIAFVGAYSFLYSFYGGDEPLLIPVFISLFGASVYATLIYAIDISIIMSSVISKPVAFLRIVMTMIMASTVGVQINVEVNHKYLSAKLEETLSISDNKKILLDKKKGLAAATELNTYYDEERKKEIEITDSMMKYVNGSASDNVNIKNEISKYENDLKTLQCMLQREQAFGDFSGCNPPQDNFGLSLSMDSSRGPNRVTPKCDDDNQSNYCVIRSKMVSINKIKDELNNQIISSKGAASSISTQLSQLLNAKNKVGKSDESDPFSPAEIEKRAKERASLQQEVNDLTNDIRKLEERAKGSMSELKSELFKAIWRVFTLSDDGNGLWILFLFIVFVIVDAAALILKYCLGNTLYDQRISIWREIEADNNRIIAEAFSSVFMSDIDVDYQYNNGKGERQSSDDDSDDVINHHEGIIRKLILWIKSKMGL